MLKIETADQAYAISVIDHLGRVMYCDDFRLMTEINTAEWAAGVYHIILNDELGGKMQMTYIKN
jgi:hypothetical protein